MKTSIITIFFRLFFLLGLIFSGYILYLGGSDYSIYYVGLSRTLLYLVFPLIVFIISLMVLFIKISKRNFIGFNLIIPILIFYSYEIYLVFSNIRIIRQVYICLTIQILFIRDLCH